MNQPIHQQLRNIRRQLAITQPHAADQLGVTLWTISTWDSGRYSPRIHPYIRYATLLGRQLIITRQGALPTPLTDVLPDLAQVRRPRIRTRDLAQRRNVRAHTITAFERRLAAGSNPTLADIQTYLRGFDHDLQITPLTQGRAA
ncbi:helix-turn-helix transcriptional regulator [Nonomuraea sp. NPDC004580]|uniref:helix-turn-helix transcriptional regulator n=1 Tax=Nonomuraea sp. NPDC004580 TaxID=3154552 RepID=UPI0033AA4431